MKTGILGAMPREIELLRADMVETEGSEIAGREYSIGKLYDKDAVLVFSRWGKVAAGSTVTTLIDRFGAELIVFTGVAGGASPRLNIGDIVIADKLLQHDMDASVLPDFAKFEIPLLGVSEFTPKSEFVKLAEDAAVKFIDGVLSKTIDKSTRSDFGIDRPRVEVGTIASGDKFIADDNHIEQMQAEIPNLQCIDMESAAAAQVCYEHKVPFVCIRVISDKADHSAIIDFPKFVERVAGEYSRGIVRELLTELS